jgi:hypothetical protein
MEDVLILEKGAQHNWAIRQYYPAHKKTTATTKAMWRSAKVFYVLPT